LKEDMFTEATINVLSNALICGCHSFRPSPKHDHMCNFGK
jgi:hypothetical protein